MTREEAERTAARHGREHPDRDRFSWIASEDPAGGWRVVRIGGAGWSLARRPLEEGEVAGLPKPAPDQSTPEPAERTWQWGALGGGI